MLLNYAWLDKFWHYSMSIHVQNQFTVCIFCSNFSFVFGRQITQQQELPTISTTRPQCHCTINMMMLCLDHPSVQHSSFPSSMLPPNYNPTHLHFFLSILRCAHQCSRFSADSLATVIVTLDCTSCHTTTLFTHQSFLAMWWLHFTTLMECLRNP